MKNKAGKICGFVIGVSGFLLLFKWIFLDNVAPSDELAPGMVVLLSLLNGLLVAYISSRFQDYIGRKRVNGGKEKKKATS